MLDTEPTGGGSDAAASAPADTTSTTSTTPAAPRRRRAASRPAGGTAQSTPEVIAPEVVTPEAANADEAAAAPAPRRRRAATRAAAPAEQSATENPPGQAPPADSPMAEVAVGEAPTASLPPKRSRARKAVASAAEVAETVSADSAPAADQADQADQAEAPAAPSRSRRRGKPAADVPADAASLETPPLAVDEVQAEPAAEAPAPRSRRRRSAAVEFAPPVVEPDLTAELPPIEKAPLPPIVTFQAPDATAPTAPTTRRRRGRAAVEEPVLPLLDADGQPIDDELADELAQDLLADATDAVALDDESSIAAEDIDEDADEDDSPSAGRRRRRGRRGRGRGRPEDAEGEADAEGDQPAEAAADDEDEAEGDGKSGTRRRRRRRSRTSGGEGAEPSSDDPPNTVVRVRTPRQSGGGDDEVRGLTGSTRLEAKRQRRREGREQGRRRPPILTEAEFLARREAIDRVMVVRQSGDRTQIAVLEDNVLVEHYVTKASATSYAGNVYLGKVQNVLPSMEAAFVDIGKGRNAVLYAGEVNYDASGIEGKAHRIEQALKPGQTIMVQVTKDPIGHKGSRLTSQISLPGRFLVYVPEGRVTGISRKLPDAERTRLKAILKRVMPEDAGVIVRTAAEGASEEDLERDVERLHAQWESIQAAAAKAGNSAPALLYAEPDLVVRVIRDIFNEDFRQLIVQGDEEWETVESYVNHLAPDLAPRLTHWVENQDAFAAHRIDEQLTKALDRKVWLPSGGSLVIDRTEAMVVVDVNTGKFVGKGGNLEETVTKNNLEAAEEVVRQLRLRDLGGIIVVDFIDMVLESNRELVLRRLMECLGRDRTKHQVAEVTSLGLVQMTRKRVGQGLLESFSETCPSCQGRGFIVHMDHGAPTVPERGDEPREGNGGSGGNGSGRERGRGKSRDRARTGAAPVNVASVPDDATRAAAAAAIAKIAAATAAHAAGGTHQDEPSAPADVEASLVEAALSESAGDPVTEESTRPSRRGRRGAGRATAPAGAPGSSDGDAAPTADVSEQAVPSSDGDQAADGGEAGTARPRRRRGGRGSGAGESSGSSDGSQGPEGATPQREPVAAAVPVSSSGDRAVAAKAPRRRRAASRPAGPAAAPAT